ncbi:hypothetical protein Bca4012_050619 [Brassica carinata]
MTDGGVVMRIRRQHQRLLKSNLHALCSVNKRKTVNCYKILSVKHFTGPYPDSGQGPNMVSDCKPSVNEIASVWAFSTKRREEKKC